jgi:hypothetical protein
VAARSDKRVWAFGAFALAAIGLAACAAGNQEDAPTVCVPGDNVFCRCPTGDPATKTCGPDGFTFSECGPCSDGQIPDDEDPPWNEGGYDASGGSDPSGGAAPIGGAGGTGGSSAGGSSEGGTPDVGGSGGTGGSIGVGGSGGEGPGPTGNKALFAQCSAGSECQSGVCKNRYCTKSCTKVSDCAFPQAECVPNGNGDTGGICLATCNTAAGCAAFGTPTSKCGYTHSIDNWDVTVCADWGTSQLLMPSGTDCLPYNHDECNLGYSSMQSVCTEAGVCAKGCYLNGDCPNGKTCSGQGSLGNCI